VTRLFAKRDSLPEQIAYQAVEEHYVLASWRAVGIAVWIDEAPVEAIQEAQRMLARLSSEHPDGIAFFQVIGEENESIDAPARNALKELLRAGREFIREAPVVYEGSGFRAAAVRAIVTGLLSQRSYGFTHRVYSSIEDGALAVGRKFEKREPTRYARELCEALASVRDRHQRLFPTTPHSFIRYKR